MGKAKPAHHTAKELQNKADLHKPRGGGRAGQAERAVKIALTCHVCKSSIASLHAMKVHYESKHPKDAFPEQEYSAQWEKARTETAGQKSQSKKYEFTGKKGPSTL